MVGRDFDGPDGIRDRSTLEQGRQIGPGMGLIHPRPESRLDRSDEFVRPLGGRLGQRAVYGCCIGRAAKRGSDQDSAQLAGPSRFEERCAGGAERFHNALPKARVRFPAIDDLACQAFPYGRENTRIWIGRKKRQAMRDVIKLDGMMGYIDGRIGLGNATGG